LANFDYSPNFAIVFSIKQTQETGGLKIGGFMSKKVILILVVLWSPYVSFGQCAMCRAVVEQGGEEVAEGINSGIVYLMAFPYILVATAFYLFYRNWKRSNAQ